MEGVNFYLLLELSIEPEEKREEVIISAINKKRSMWSAMMNHPTKKNEARGYLELIPEIKRVMVTDKIARKNEARLAREEIKKEKIRATEKIKNALNVILLKGYISIEEKEKIKTDYSVLGDVALNNLLAPYKICGKFNKKIDPVIYDRIRDNLRLIDKENLYKFLAISNKASFEEIRYSSNAIYEELRKITKKDSVVTAKGELQGFCDLVFKNRESREEYDKILKEEKLNSITYIIEICASKKYITKEESKAILRLVEKEGFTKVEARNFLLAFSIKNKISININENDNDNYIKKEKSETIKKNEFIDVSPEVSNVRITSGNGEIKALWTAPKEASSIMVWRVEGKIPTKAGDGLALKKVTKEGFIDDGLKAGMDYGYIICVVYNKNGKQVYSKGIKKFGITESPKNKEAIFKQYFCKLKRVLF